jgi:hypothetical protein
MSKRIVLTLVSCVFVLAIATSATAAPLPVGHTAKAAQAAPEDDAVVLPSRVAGAIRRTTNALAKAEEHIDEAEYTKAIVSLRAVRKFLGVADKSARRQMSAVPADPEVETTTGPDSVVAVLSLDQEVVVGLAGLLTGQTGTLVGAIGTTIAAAQATRDKLLDTVIGLDPEGDGAAYADGMADTLDGYADEVDNLTEALALDVLSSGGKSILNAALVRSKATEAKIQSAFGGGE